MNTHAVEGGRAEDPPRATLFVEVDNSKGRSAT